MLNGRDLLTGLSSFDFAYFNRDGAALAMPLSWLDRTNIWQVQIRFTLTSGGQTLSFEERVVPRSMLRSNK
jgi:hypothetical protein